MIQILKSGLSHTDGIYSEARFENSENLTVRMTGSKIAEVSHNNFKGGITRVLKDGGLAYTSFSNPENLKDAMKNSEKSASILGKHTGLKESLAAYKPVKDNVKATPEIDPRTISLEEKVELLKKYSALCMENPKVQTTNLVYQETVNNETFVNSEGSEISQEILLCRIAGTIISRDGNRIEQVRISLGFDEDFGKLLNREDIVEKRAGLAVDLLNAESPNEGLYTVICDPDLAGIFVHEAFGHLSESDHLASNIPIREMIPIGKVIGPEYLNIIDDATIPGAPGTYAYDHEGVAGSRTSVVTNGVISDYICSRNSAYHLDRKPTGNFRSSDYRFSPFVRMSNIFIDQGTCNVDEMISNMPDGLYLCGGKGGQTLGDLFTFGAAYGYIVKNGKLGKMLTNLNISGNIFDTMGNIVEIGSNLRFSEWGG
ncbi:TldD/PmbA family protein, partial [bacterium]|nr:TldD/PmbA family protein [bacterium]